MHGNYIQLTDTAGAITSQISGVTDTGLTNGSAVIPGQVQDIVISGQSSLTTLTLSPDFSTGGPAPTIFDTSRSLVLNATTITTTAPIDADSITATGQVIYLGGNLSSAGFRRRAGHRPGRRQHHA